MGLEKSELKPCGTHFVRKCQSLRLLPFAARHFALQALLVRIQPKEINENALANDSTVNPCSRMRSHAANNAPTFNGLLHCEAPSEVDHEDAGAYATAYVETLILAAAATRTGDELTKIKTLTDFFVKAKTIAAYYRCSIDHLSPFLQSKNEKISMAAKFTSEAISTLLAYIEHSLQQVRQKSDPDSSVSDAEAQANWTLKVRETWENFPLTGVAASHVVLNPETKTLKITKRERDALIARLDSAFGTTTRKKDEHSVIRTADVFRGFLRDDWKYAPIKK